MLVLVDRVHRQQSQPVADLAVQWHTQIARRVAHHEGDELRSGLLGGEDEIALVLAILVVDDDDGLARSDVGYRPLDGIKPRHHISMNHGGPVIAAPSELGLEPHTARFSVLAETVRKLRESCHEFPLPSSSAEPNGRPTYFAARIY